ncbi:hypothetical protein J6590_058486, partial [Homalodisca vitripennis]
FLTGHGSFGSYLKRLHLTDDDGCLSGKLLWRGGLSIPYLPMLTMGGRKGALEELDFKSSTSPRQYCAPYVEK